MFKLKLDHLIKNLKDDHVLGKVKGVVYTVEFQKRGPPHAHILFFEECDKLRTPEDIDRVISTEIPDKEVDNSLSRPEYVWEQTYDKLTNDILHIRRKEINEPEAIKHIALAKIEKMLLANGMSLKDIPNMPFPDFRYIEVACNMLIQDELGYDKEKLEMEHQGLHASLTAEQLKVYDTVMDAVAQDDGGVFFLYGYGGTGKTFVWKTLSSAIRRKGSIVLNVASSGIVALLLTGGRTTHSRFAIPLNPTEDSFCNINSDNPLADLIREARLIIWDEATMMHKHCFEALDRTMRDIIQGPNSHKPFGGKVIVFGGDFRQILPVIPGGNREEIVNASLNHSSLWDHCKVLTLTQNMRLQSGTNAQEKEEIKKFTEWILTVGEGTAGGNNDGSTEIELLEEVLIKSEKNHVESIVSANFPSIAEHHNDRGYFEDKAILVPTNEEVDTINEYVLSKLKGDERIYFNSDSVCQSEFIDEFQQSLYAPEILNGFKISGIPNHKLVLKEGVSVMLLRNIDQSNGLCNGTRLRVTRLGKNVIEAEVISGNNIGYKTYIPRMKLIPSDKRIPFRFNRRQFLLIVSFAMTINKSQGQSLSIVGLYLQRPVFTHGQLYVAISRVKSKKGLKVLIYDKDGKTTNTTTNVVYKEVLQKMKEDM
uniref:ATP-dependent DNA helicase PIF1-like n=1 Tax=Erigeron canadensis TaxID=72917 RepID=UPI001CB8C809|nr:ATP-dependent DNA helicase PIF1-like [Erigeron canadensis]